MIFRYLSLCAGIEAATVAWHPLGWQAAAFSEIEAFPRAVLQHHYPQVPLHGDFTTIEGDEYGAIDLLVGGTPCQSFSVAGLRKGLADDRGNLALAFILLAQRTRPLWVVWENVPGVLSIDGGRAFGAFLGGLAECGYGFAYRILDAQYFGVPQRRRRVFVVGYFGDWRPAAAVLFERESLRGDITPRRETRQDAAAFTPSSLGGYRNGTGTLRANGGDLGGGSETLLAGVPEVAGCLQERDAKGADSDTKPGHLIPMRRGVRKLTPRECERLQGFPDNYTRVPFRGKPAADGPRYKALGNSMAVPVMRWLGERIQKIEELQQRRAA